MVTRGWGDQGKRELFFNVYRISDLPDENVLESCFETIRIYLTLWNCTLKNGEDKFYVMWFFSYHKREEKKNQHLKYYQNESRLKKTTRER